jgi:hypothetical protein
MRIPRQFNARTPEEQSWLQKNTWCERCARTDLGRNSLPHTAMIGQVLIKGARNRINAISIGRQQAANSGGDVEMSATK